MHLIARILYRSHCPNFGPLLDARDSLSNKPRMFKQFCPQPWELLSRVTDCSGQRKAYSHRRLLDPRFLKPKVNTVLNVKVNVVIVCDPESRLRKPYKLHRLREGYCCLKDYALTRHLVQKVEKLLDLDVLEHGGVRSFFGYANCMMSLKSQANDSILICPLSYAQFQAALLVHPKSQ